MSFNRAIWSVLVFIGQWNGVFVMSLMELLVTEVFMCDRMWECESVRGCACARRGLVSFCNSPYILLVCQLHCPLVSHITLFLSLSPFFQLCLVSSCISFLHSFLSLRLSFCLFRPHGSLHKHICDNSPRSLSNPSTEAHKSKGEHEGTSATLCDLFDQSNTTQFSVLH